MKKLTFFVLILFSSIVCSEELKLKCDIKVVSNFSDGSTEKNQVTETLKILDLGTYKSIIPSSTVLISVSTDKSTNTISVSDLSNSNVWDITEKTFSKNETPTTVSYVIDRNLGKIWYSDTFTSSGFTIKTSGVGDCEKIDVTKKKF